MLYKQEPVLMSSWKSVSFYSIIYIHFSSFPLLYLDKLEITSDSLQLIKLDTNLFLAVNMKKHNFHFIVLLCSNEINNKINTRGWCDVDSYMSDLHPHPLSHTYTCRLIPFSSEL